MQQDQLQQNNLLSRKLVVRKEIISAVSGSGPTGMTDGGSGGSGGGKGSETSLITIAISVLTGWACTCG